MKRKPLALCLSGVMLVGSGWTWTSTATVTTCVAAGSLATVTGCSKNRRETRQDARVETRTSERAEERVKDRRD